MPVDNYEQYKRVINQITGRLYMHIYIRNQDVVWFKKKIDVCVVIYNNLLLIHL